MGAGENQAQTDPVGSPSMSGLIETLASEMANIHILISDGHYHAAATQIAAAVQAQLTSVDALDKAIIAAEQARCPHREGPYGGYDYGHRNDEPVPGGRHVVRDFRDPSSPDWGKWLHQTDDPLVHEKVFERMTAEHIIGSITAALLGSPSLRNPETNPS